MYFSNKFNKEVQKLVRGMSEKGVSTNIDYINSNLWRVESFQHDIMKIIPLVMYNKLYSSNHEDTVFDNSIVISKQHSGTTIHASGDTSEDAV